MRFLASILLFAGTAVAGEYALLSNGSRLHADRHESEAGKLRLYMGGGFVELDAAQVQGFEAEEPAVSSLRRAVSPRHADCSSPPLLPGNWRMRQPTIRPAPETGAQRNCRRISIPAESAFPPKGAIGLMQLMPATARSLGADPHDPAQNVDAGTRHLRNLLEKYNYGLWHALAAYNAGEGAVRKIQGHPSLRRDHQLRQKDRQGSQKGRRLDSVYYRYPTPITARIMRGRSRRSGRRQGWFPRLHLFRAGPSRGI